MIGSDVFESHMHCNPGMTWKLLRQVSRCGAEWAQSCQVALAYPPLELGVSLLVVCFEMQFAL
jgi:hypothetical protein